MKAIVIVLNDESYLDSLLELLRINGVHGGTIMNSQGLFSLRYATHPNELPIFAPLSDWTNDVHPTNKTLFSLVDDDKEIKLLRNINKLFHSYDHPGKGIAFSLDVSKALGVRHYSDEDDLEEDDELNHTIKKL